MFKAKKILSFLLVLALVWGILPLRAGAAEVFSGAADAADYLRDCMKARMDTAVIEYRTTESYTAVLAALDEAIQAHTGVPSEGDYLTAQGAAWEVSASGTYEDDIYCMTLTYTFSYLTTAEQETAVDGAVARLLAELIRADMTDYEKIEAVYGWICENVSYDSCGGDIARTVYGALVERSAVCQGYAALMYRLALEMGIDCRVITGTAAGEPHAWNIVELDGTYYHVDATWDSGSDASGYGYFLKSDDSFADHTRDDAYESAAFYEAYPVSDLDYGDAIDETAPTSGTCGDHLTWVLDESGILTISGTGLMDDYGYQETPWYPRRSAVKKVVTESGVTGLGDFAFASCKNLTEAVLPEEMLLMGDYAFYECRALTDITLPTELRVLSMGLFWGCASLENLTIPMGITDVYSFAFTECTSLKDMTFPEGVKTLGCGVFNGCTSLVRVTFPESVETLDKEMFYGCSSLISVNIPAGITVIGRSMFAGCAALEAIEIPDSVTTIGDAAFSGCASLKAIEFPDSITSLGEDVISGCTGLVSLVLPKCLTAIDDWAFYGLTSLKTVVIPDSVTSIGDGAFDCCVSLETVNIPEGVTEIGLQAFQCTNLKTAIIPDSVLSIGDAAFAGCGQLESVILPEGLASIGYAMFTTCPKLSDVTIPEGVTSIGDYAFASCERLEKIVIPGAVVSIGDTAFSGCTGLTSIVFEGDAPEIHPTAFGEVTANAGYPAGNDTWTAGVMQNYGGAITWAAYCAGDHVEVADPAVAATCTGAGLTAGSHCGACGEILAAQETVVPLGHRYTAVLTDPTCTAGGYTTYTCSVCQNRYTSDLTDALSHNYVNSVCANCGDRSTAIEAPVVKGRNVASSGKVKLSWSAVDGAAKYQIYRSTSKSSGYKLMKTTTGTSYANTSAETGTTYYYYIVAVAEDGTKSDKSGIVTRTCDLPRPVVSISNAASSGKIKLTWDSVEGAVKYRVYRSASKSGTYKLMKTTTGTSYTNTSAKVGTLYYYKVVAVAEKSAANSAYSSVKSRTCDLPRPDVSIALKNGKPRLTWDAVDGAVSYKIYRSASKNGTYTLMKTTTGTSYTNTSAKSGTTYYYKVIAVHSRSAANSAYSAVVYAKAK